MHPRWIAPAAVIALISHFALAAPSESDKLKARDLANEAFDAYDAKQYPLAHENFQKADDLYPAPTLKLGAARSLIKMGKLVSAADKLQITVDTPLAKDASPEFKKAKADAEKELTKLKPRLAQLTLHVAGPKSPTITFDDQPFSLAALDIARPVDPDPVEHTVRVTAAGFNPAEEKFKLPEGKPVERTITLTPAAAPPPLMAPVAPAAPVSAPPPPPAPPPASAPPPEAPPPPPSPEASKAAPEEPEHNWFRRHQSAFGGVTTAIGGLFLAAGAVAGIKAKKAHDDLAENCPGGECGEGYREDIETFYKQGDAATGAFVIGGVLVGGGIALLATAPSSGPPKPEVKASIGPGFISARGRF